MKTWMRWLTAAAVALTLAACDSSSDDAGAPVFGGGDGDGGTGGTSVSSLIIEAPVQMANTASSSVSVTVTALDANRRTVADAQVELEVDNDGILTSAEATDSDGRLVAVLSIGSNRTDRLLTVKATSGSATATATVQVIGTQINATVPPVVAPGASAQVQYRVVDRSGSPMAGQAIAVAADGLTPASASGVTGPNGDYVYNFSTPTAGGSYRISATVGGVTDVQTLQVQPTSTVPVVTDTITSASVSANPSVVATNVAGSSTNRSEIRALFLGPNNKPIPNVRVRFDLAGDPNSIGGTFTTGSQTLYTDANGVVTTAYVPGTQQSPTDGVIIRACYGTSDNDAKLTACTGTPPPPTTRLTVTRDALGVSIGTNELIVVNELSYVKRFLVTVTDSAGAAKADVDLSVSLDLTQYRKGFYVLVGDAWAKAGTVLPLGDEAVCANEDLNRNGVLEDGEDVNGSGRLDPGRSDVTVRLLQTSTAADGTAVVEILYAKSFATWIDAVITVSASGVSGTEGRATYTLPPIPADAASIKNKDVAPAYRVSPYGTAASCTDPN